MPLRADGLPLRAFRSPGLRLAAPICLPEACPQWLLSDGGSPLTVARQLRFRTGFPWCPALILSLSSRGRRERCEAQIRTMPFRRHGEVKPVSHEGQLEVGRRKSRPGAAPRP